MNTESGRTSLLEWDRKRWKCWLHEQEASPAHATTLIQQIHRYGSLEPERMVALPLRLRHRLEHSFRATLPEIAHLRHARDGTCKCTLRLSCGQFIEMVLIPSAARTTLCISSQAGCALGCTFCHTARGGLHRNLSIDEIVAQLWLARHRLWPESAISNVVFMGMGEPLANLDAVLGTLRLFQDDHAYGLGCRRITVSTAGLVPGIERLGHSAEVSLAVSLHAPDDALRTELMPINTRYPIEKLLQACVRYAQRGLRRRRTVTIEYALLAGINDAESHAQMLARRLQGLPVKVNLIPFNPFPGSDYMPSAPEVHQNFFEALNGAGVVTTTRRARGQDIAAACGQLAGESVLREVFETQRSPLMALQGAG